MADDFDPDGESVEIDETPDNVREHEDGSVTVMVDESAKPGESDFYANLAETLPDTVLSTIAADLIDLIQKDKESRAKRDEQYKKGIQRTGLGNDAPGGAEFEGASRVVHPMLTEVCVDFSSRAVKELWPANGPVKAKIIGDPTKARVLKAHRKSELLNWQLTIAAKEARAEFEQMLTQLPLGGGQYLKATWDRKRNRPQFLFVAIDDIYLPYAATNFYTAQRKTHVQYITRLEYEQRIKDGLYREVLFTSPSQVPEGSAAQRANDKVEGREDNAYNDDGLRTEFEVYVTMTIPGDDLADGAAPYIVTVDETSRDVLAVYRNWEEDDPSQEELHWIVEWPFIPWRGAYPIGMTQMIGDLSGAATGALRALLDSAHIQNSASMVKLKGGTRGGQSLTIQPTQIAEIEGGLNVDDIRKLAMPLPFNGPSPVLMELLGFLVEAGKGVVRTTLDTTVESQENVPVGTTLARIEQGMTVFSAIHLRLHNAMQRLLDVLHRLNAMYLDDAMLEAEAGSIIASRSDFTGPMDVVPVSDPNIFSEAQRFAQMQAVAQRAALRPDLYNSREVEERILTTLKIPNAEGLLAPKMAPTEENAVSENVKASLGRPIVAFPDQDHIAHLKTHLPYMRSPVFGSSRLMASTFLPVMVSHIKEHIALWYAQEVFATANEATGDQLSEMIGRSKDKGAKQALDRLVAVASLDVVEDAPDVFGQMPQVIEQAIEMVAALTPPIPGDPAVQVAMEDVKARERVGMAKVKIDEGKLAQAGQKAALDAQDKDAGRQVDARTSAEDRAAEFETVQMREQHEDARTAAEIASRERVNADDNRVAMEMHRDGLIDDEIERDVQRTEQASEREFEGLQRDEDRRASARRVSQDPNPNPRPKT